MSGQRRDLLVTTHTPTLGSGRAMRTYGIARALARSGELTILYARFGAQEPDETYTSMPSAELNEVVPSRGVRRLASYVRARLAGVPRDFAKGASPELAREAQRLARTVDADRVIADGPVAAAALRSLSRERPVIYNAHNLESSFRHELSDDRGLRGLRSFERRLLERASESWMVSEADIQAARELCPSARLRLVPNVIDVAAIEPVGATTEQQAIFVADFSYEPNRDALRFLLDEVMPSVWGRLPEARLTLAGRGLGEEQPSRDPRVRALGFVDDLAGAYAQARCAVVPLRHGGGSPLKLVEALAYGLPVVATPRAVAGLELQDGIDCLIAEGASSFADALVRVLSDGAPEIANAGRRVAEERYSVQALAAFLRT
jgi:polysaccharide biosynthesis protein PslH